MPYDLWVTKADVEVPDPAERSLQLNWRTPGSPEAVAKALELLLGARRPLILAGGGVVCSEASAELAAFAEHVNIPVYTSFMGKGPVGPAPAASRDRGLLGRVPGPGGGAERGRDPGARLPVLGHPQLVVAARLHVQHPAHRS